jgi:hypothetical protein
MNHSNLNFEFQRLWDHPDRQDLPDQLACRVRPESKATEEAMEAKENP